MFGSKVDVRCLVAHNPRCSRVVILHPSAAAFILNVPSKSCQREKPFSVSCLERAQELPEFCIQQTHQSSKKERESAAVLNWHSFWALQLCYFGWLCVLLALHQPYAEMSVKEISI